MISYHQTPQDVNIAAQGVDPLNVDVTAQTADPFNVDITAQSLAALNITDPALEVARGNVSGQASVNKFGRAPAGLQTTTTDVWDLADATPTQSVWLAPTAARIHAIVSTSDEDSDTGGAVAQGDGCRTLRIYGLKTWGTAESSEDIIMDGTTAKNTVNSYVIIHRMKALTWNTLGPNVGLITATAASDATITAAIVAGSMQGQTEMAIYGVPSTEVFYMYQVYAAINKSGGAAASADMSVFYNPIPDVLTTQYINKQTFSAVKDGSSDVSHPFNPPKIFTGPGIIKINGLGSAADLDLSAGFDGVRVTN